MKWAQRKDIRYIAAHLCSQGATDFAAVYTHN